MSTVADMYANFSRSQAAGRSPLYEALTAAVAEDPHVLAFLEPLPEAKQQPLLLLGAVRYLHGVPADYPQFRQWVLGDQERLHALMLERSTQTNEPARCTGLLPVLGLIPGPLALVEVGASAGLCLYPDRYRYDFGATQVGPADSPVLLRCRVTGPVPVPETVPDVVARVGIDLDPVDLDDPDAVRWLEALIWPEQRERFPRLAAAARIARSEPARMVRGDLLERLPAVIESLPPGCTPVVFHTAVMPYLTHEARRDFVGLVTSLPVRWISQEGPGFLAGRQDRQWPSGPEGRFVLALDGVPVGLTDPHGGVLDWTAGDASAGQAT